MSAGIASSDRSGGERLSGSRGGGAQATLLPDCFEQACDRWPEAVAVVCGRSQVTYAELDRRANRLAHLLRARGARESSPVGILLERSVDTYVALLGVIKAGAAYVPIDPSFPADRVAYIAADSRLCDLITTSAFRKRTRRLPCPSLEVDQLQDRLARQPGTRPGIRLHPDSLCYVIYTSGSTGQPKGVACSHANIVNFLRVATPVYGVTSRDRVHQGLSIAFDFSVEEIWPAWIAGATLVTGPSEQCRRAGRELAGFLTEHRITVLCCVPTLLATVDDELPSLRLLLVSGEACPPDLVRRWARPGLRMLNAYGPTETTVTATCGELVPGRPVTLGRPLPSYRIYILDERLRRVAPGESGELCIGGPGVAIGYVRRPEVTAERFVPNPYPADRAEAPRLYRSGDLARLTPEGEIEYLGRIDDQVKVRGYRVELGEIEQVLREDPAVRNAVVRPLEREGAVQLVGYLTLHEAAARTANGELRPRLLASLRRRLPPYMVPTFLEVLDELPLLAADKVDRAALPPPASPPLGVRQGPRVPPGTGLERRLAEVWQEVQGIDGVSVTDNLFTDLGADSLLVARFCALARKRAGLASLAMKDVYLHPTIRALAASREREPAAPPPGWRTAAPRPAARDASTWRYLRCGALQLVAFLVAACLGALAVTAGYQWISTGRGAIEVSLRSLVAGDAGFLALCIVPILAKWLLIGRWRPGEIPVWSLAYVRFWTVRTLIRICPLAGFTGSPLYVLYLRALGARIGRGVVILSGTVPVCTDLLTVGTGTVLRKDCSFTGFRVEAGVLRTGAVTLGRDVVVGEGTVLDIGTAMGDGAQLGHSSCLLAGQAVPAGQRWHGSPAQPTQVDHRRVAPTGCPTWRRVRYGLQQLLGVLLVGAPVVAGGSVLLAGVLGSDSPVPTGGAFCHDLLVVSLMLVAVVLGGLAIVTALPRMMNLALIPDRVYPLYGWRYTLQRAITRITNRPFFMEVFGDSSYVVGYLRILGYDLGRVEQTGSNFGVALKHDIPYLSRVGTGTMVSDGLSIINADFSSTSFCVRPVSIGARNFLGNDIAYPAGARVGDNCLLATKVMVPLDGPLREGVGLLGSPPFEIPRTVQRDRSFDHLETGDELRRRLRGKNRHNAATIALFLLVRWAYLVTLAWLGTVAGMLYERFGTPAIAADEILSLLVGVVFFVLVERASTGFRALRPQLCSIYDRIFWRHERFWKLSGMAYLGLFNGTAFKGSIWRLLGVDVGRRLFDDGCSIPERTLVRLGDDCTLDAESVIQGHSLEDGTFKSDRITIGSGCTLGTRAFVHYGVTMADGTMLDADSFLMKGEETAPHARWRGNPAREVGDGPSLAAARTAARP